MIKKKMLIYLVLLIFATIFMGIGYAAVNNVTLDLNGDTSVKAYEGIKIKDVTYLSNVDADITNSKINTFSNTLINSTIILGNNKNSTITYQITLENDTDYDYQYIDTIYDEKFYDNNNIKYEISGISSNEVISSNSEKIITITFKYANDDISKNTLNSYLNVKFAKLYTITYENITTNNYPTSVIEDGNVVITFVGDIPDDVSVTGEADKIYENGLLTLSNVKSNIVITKSINKYYYTLSANHNIGDIIDNSNYSQDIDDVSSPYIRYKMDQNNKVIQIDSCKKETSNSNSICLIGIDTTKYEVNKNNILSYFGGSVDNIPANCTEEENLGNNVFSCSNSFTQLKAASDGTVSIIDKENNKSCNINLDSKTCN